MSRTLLSLSVLLCLALSAIASPVIQARQDGPGHPYACGPEYEAAARKTKLIHEGANSLDLAITVMETSCHMNASYPMGDAMPGGAAKTGDSANFGLFKNNWYNIRTYCSRFRGQTEADWRNGEWLNSHDVSAIQCQHEQMGALGHPAFFEAQRGMPGEGVQYGQAIAYIQDFLKQGHLHTDMVTFYTLHAV